MSGWTTAQNAASSISSSGWGPEMWVRPDLARILAEPDGSTSRAGTFERYREILGGGEEWRGRAGHTTPAEAVVLSCEERMDEADAAFARAHDTLERHRLREDEADALRQWGRALARAGADSAAAEKLDQALEIYRRHDAGSPWLKRVRADRGRLPRPSR
jgi:tetratricopeptide (TPR) repeat protein